MAIEKYGSDMVDLYYMVIDSAHEDNKRFIEDCEKWYGKKINLIRSEKYTDHFDVIKKERYVNGVAGARCTLELKKKVRYKLEESIDFCGQIFGFEFEMKEINRAIRFTQQFPDTMPVFPLIDRKVNKQQCAELLLKNGVQLPKMYELGFHNNNCIGCVKGGKGYWNHIRKHFPDTFLKMSLLEREVGHSCVKNKFLDELGINEGKHEPPIVPDCGTFCEIEFADIIDPQAEEVYAGYKTFKQLNLF